MTLLFLSIQNWYPSPKNAWCEVWLKLENMMILNDANLLSPLAKVWKDLNFLYPLMLIQTYTWVDHHLQNVWTLLTKKSNLSSMQNFSSFILSHFYANYKEVSTFVSMQLETYLIQLEQLSPSAPSHGPPLKNIIYILYRKFLA